MSSSGRAVSFQHIELYKILDIETGAYFTVKDLLASIPAKTERRKTEVVYDFSPALTIPTTSTDLINLIKARIPTTGTLAPFFNVTTNKFKPFKIGSSVTLKINIIGSRRGGSTNCSMVINVTNTTGNRLVESRDANITTDDLSFPTFFSVDVGGNLVTNGSPITIQSNGDTFTCTKMVIIAEQVVPVNTPAVIPN